VEDAVLEIVAGGTSDTFNAVTAAPAAGAATHLVSDKFVADLNAGATIRIITETPSAWKTTIAADLDPGSAACTAVRASVKFLVDNRCDVGEGGFNTMVSGSIARDLAIAMGKVTTATFTAATTVATSETGWFSQVYAACGHAPKDIDVDSKTNCTHGSPKATWANCTDAKNTTSGAWSRFGAVLASATLAALAF
jgi:hypothetical protein